VYNKIRRVKRVMGYIYGIVDKSKNNWIYVGESEYDVDDRWVEHTTSNSTELDRYIKKKGAENFVALVLDDSDDGNPEKLKFWIEKMGTTEPYGFNKD